MNRARFLNVYFAEVKLVHCIIIFTQEISENLHFRSHQYSIEEQFLLITVGEVSNKLATSLIENCHGPFLAIVGLWSQELYMDLHNFERLKTKHRLNRFLDNFGLSFGRFSKLDAFSVGLVLATEWMNCSTVGLGLDDLEGAVDVEIEGQVGLGVVSEC